jgi:hypothetical protein
VQESAGKRDRGHYLYRLCGVVVHSGSAFAGHYYSYIKVCGPSPRHHGSISVFCVGVGGWKGSAFAARVVQTGALRSRSLFPAPCSWRVAPLLLGA